MELGSCYYEIFDRFKDDGTQISPCNDTQLVVLFFDDPIIDVQAEVLKMRAEPRAFPCLTEFKSYAREDFKAFNGRQLQQIMSSILYEEVDIATFSGAEETT